MDILSRPPLQDSTIALCDIDAGKLKAVEAYVRKVIDSNGLPAKLEASTESDRHFPEYVPYFQHDERDEIFPYMEITRGVKGKRQKWYEDMGVSVEQADSIQLVRSHESLSGIMEALFTGQAFTFSGNVINNGLINNLPQGCCVEIPVVVDRDGFHPRAIGDLPAACAALCRTHIGLQELTVQAIRDRSRAKAFQALLLDPATNAVLSIKKARRMFDELWKAEGDLLQCYQ